MKLVSLYFKKSKTTHLVVEYHHFDWQFVGGRGFELAEIHADAGVAVDIDDDTIGLRELRPNRGG